MLIRTIQSQTPKVLDNEQAELGKHVTQLFYTLQLGGVLEYGEADSLKGSFTTTRLKSASTELLGNFPRAKDIHESR